MSEDLENRAREATEYAARLAAQSGYIFEDSMLLLQALTHSTFSNERPGSGGDNERLEFLGDAVVGLLSAQLLFTDNPMADEGTLTRSRAAVVSGKGLAKLADVHGLATLLRVGKGVADDSGCVPLRLVSSAFEALAGALYLDGGMDAVEQCLGESVKQALQRQDGALDPKTALQEYCQGHDIALPTYSTVAEHGPAHAREYTVAAVVGDKELGRGRASSRKKAEKRAATLALEVIAMESNQ